VTAVAAVLVVMVFLRLLGAAGSVLYVVSLVQVDALESSVARTHAAYWVYVVNVLRRNLSVSPSILPLKTVLPDPAVHEGKDVPTVAEMVQTG